MPAAAVNVALGILGAFYPRLVDYLSLASYVVLCNQKTPKLVCLILLASIKRIMLKGQTAVAGILIFIICDKLLLTSREKPKTGRERVEKYVTFC